MTDRALKQNHESAARPGFKKTERPPGSLELRIRQPSTPSTSWAWRAMFMGFFGITEGAIPFAAADPARVIPANMVGGAVAGATAARFGATNSVPHGGGIVALLGAVRGVPGYLIAIALGSIVTALMTVGLKPRHEAKNPTADEAPVATSLAPWSPPRWTVKGR